ncbi:MULTISPECIES: hypothetical protein [Sphingobacterium]|jgi:hypothetical protein|uniref:hypothetical protein n=1 Tax=Sphingobacterium TaxID=28453 RepID=UPI000389FE8C|nr:hypothetical protein [Sphingobacterium sp. IITKGP-BTPF85]KKX47449.1 hypothetical protein L950_0226415 [Sphingobacterium sp. IITKGP-BTPF85]
MSDSSKDKEDIESVIKILVYNAADNSISLIPESYYLTGADVPKYDNTTILFVIVQNKKAPFRSEGALKITNEKRLSTTFN